MGLNPVLVKVCGLTRPDQAEACARAGADFIGLNFHPGSPRYVDPSLAAEIAAALPVGCQAVGLFVDRPVVDVERTAGRVGLAWVQLHGDEPPADVAALARRRVVKAFRLRAVADVESLRHYMDEASRLRADPQPWLVDSYSPGAHGGTGRVIETGLLDGLASLPYPELILAGGLTPENVAERVARVRPWMVDVASGVESSPGVKDLDKVVAFVAAVRGALPTRQGVVLD